MSADAEVEVDQPPPSPATSTVSASSGSSSSSIPIPKLKLWTLLQIYEVWGLQTCWWKFWSLMKWNTENLEYYTSIWPVLWSITRVTEKVNIQEYREKLYSSSIWATKKVDIQKIFRNNDQILNKYSRFSVFLHSIRLQNVTNTPFHSNTKYSYSCLTLIILSKSHNNSVWIFTSRVVLHSFWDCLSKN